MAVLSAGLVLYRRTSAGDVELLIAHMGGPFWARKDEGAWSFPKGVVEPGEKPLDAARRELTEELGVPAPPGPFVPLGEVRQSGKTVVAWAVEADLDPADVVPGTFELEWPPRSGRTEAFPEVDRVAWVGPDDAVRLLVKAQRGFVPRLLDVVRLG
ncbi:NUDIX domain-containing protein [Aeromicrobium massiliense]|uniref:NUDIX domain-containing protein n=1 Tax=Aeromicrobium massiliense TaxID=1464554 RepID=UPI00031136B6|nr:NUDIX domain-containing protein [Aeromicrobium massiliense]